MSEDNNCTQTILCNKGAEKTRLNAKMYIEFMYVEGAHVLQMIDDANHSSAAQFVEPLTLESVWDIKLILWAAVNTGLPNTFTCDDF